MKIKIMWVDHMYLMEAVFPYFAHANDLRLKNETLRGVLYSSVNCITRQLINKDRAIFRIYSSVIYLNHR